MKKKLSILTALMLLALAIVPTASAACNHSWSVISNTNAGCTVGGSTRYYCIKCHTMKTETSKPLGHRYACIYTKDSTVFEEGYKTMKCQRSGCKAQYNKTIAKKEPDWNAIHKRYGDSDLHYGDENSYVKNLQTDLKAAGTYTDSQIDGKFKNQTTKSVEMFKRTVGISDGKNGTTVNDNIKMYLYYKTH